MRLQPGRSYAWLFAAWAALLIGGALIFGVLLHRLAWGLFVVPAFFTFLLVAQLRSGVALDSHWRASHLRGTTAYALAIVVAVVLLVLSTAWSVAWLVQSHGAHVHGSQLTSFASRSWLVRR